MSNIKIDMGEFVPSVSGDTTIKIQPGKQTRRYEIAQLVKESDPILRQECEDWDFVNPDKMPMPAIRMARLLIDTAKSYGAVGLAAPQVGHPYRVFCIGDGKDQWQICFNPTFTAGLERREGTEGCLSFPGLSLPIERSHEITAVFQMPDGTWREEKYEGMTARAYQHEFDHTVGTVFTSYVGEMKLIMAREKRRKLIRKLERNKKR